MTRLLVGGISLFAGLLAACGGARAADRAQTSMTFELRREGPAALCGNDCRTFVAAAGAITVDTARDFETFAAAHDIRGALLVLDSGGGAVRGAMVLGRAIRKLGMTTTVGRTIDIPGPDAQDIRAHVLPDAACESMCAFVLLAGTRRQLAPEARVLVHQIWLGDRRDDAVAATYSAEDLMLVQRDIGRLAQYTIEMGGTIDLLEIALRIPPWERMHVLSPEEVIRTRLATIERTFEPVVASVTSNSAPSANIPPLTGISERGWSVVERAGQTVLARRHPLTREGEQIGSFDLMFACGAAGDAYDVTYIERRRGAEPNHDAEALKDVALSLGRKSWSLRVVSSRLASTELASLAEGMVPAAVLKTLAGPGNGSMMVETSAADNAETTIWVGNTGLAQSIDKLATTCKH